MDSYIGITLHWLTEMFILKRATVGIVHFTGSHTAAAIADQIKVS